MDGIIETHDRIVAALSNGEDGYIFLHFVDFVPEEGGGAREAYAWKLFDEDMVLIGESDLAKKDYLMAGVGFHPLPRQMLSSLLSFLQAAGEQYQSTMRSSAEPVDGPIFNAAISEWAYQMETPLLNLMLELEN